MPLLKKLRDFAAEQWWRFLIGIQVLTLINFALLVVTASDKLKNVIPVEYTAELVLIFVPLALLGVWVAGLVLEKYIKFPQAQERAARERSPTWNENFKRLDEISERLSRIEKKVK